MMPRIRTVKPELFKHEDLYEAEINSQLPLRLGFIALLGCCDREGRFSWRPKRLKIDMLPYDNIDLSKVLEALSLYGFIKTYTYEGEQFGYIPSWSRHQHINQREAASTLPPPSLSLEKASVGENAKSEENRATTADSQAEKTPKSTILTEQKCSEQQPAIQLPEKPTLSGTTTSLSSDVTQQGVVGEPIDHQPEPMTSSTFKTPHSRVCTCASLPCTCGREGKGREWEKEREVEGNSIVVAPERSLDKGEAISHVFEHWKKVMNHPQARLDPKRRALIAQALACGYEVRQLCLAIEGCSITPHNCGDNERGQRYDGLQVILRDSDQIDRFIHNYYSPPRPLNKAQRKTQANVQSLERWAHHKLQGGSHARV